MRKEKPKQHPSQRTEGKKIDFENRGDSQYEMGLRTPSESSLQIFLFFFPDILLQRDKTRWDARFCFDSTMYWVFIIGQFLTPGPAPVLRCVCICEVILE